MSGGDGDPGGREGERDLKETWASGEKRGSGGQGGLGKERRND